MALQNFSGFIGCRDTSKKVGPSLSDCGITPNSEKVEISDTYQLARWGKNELVERSSSSIDPPRMHYSYRNSAILVSNFFRNFLEISDFFQNRGLAFFWNQGNIGTFNENWTSVIQAVFRNTRWWCKSAWNKAGWIWKYISWTNFCVRVPLKLENWISFRLCFRHKLSKIWLKRGTAKYAVPLFAFVSDTNWAK